MVVNGIKQLGRETKRDKEKKRRKETKRKKRAEKGHGKKQRTGNESRNRGMAAPMGVYARGVVVPCLRSRRREKRSLSRGSAKTRATAREAEARYSMLGEGIERGFMGGLLGWGRRIGMSGDAEEDKGGEKEKKDNKTEKKSVKEREK